MTTNNRSAFVEAAVGHIEWESRQHIPADVQRAVLDRDNCQCQICGTAGENRLQLHHWAQFRSHGGAHTPENLVTLCFRCHEDVHAGRIDIVLIEIAPSVWMAFPSMDLYLPRKHT